MASATAEHCTVGAGLIKFTVWVMVEFENVYEVSIDVANVVKVDTDWVVIVVGTTITEVITLVDTEVVVDVVVCVAIKV